MKLLLMTAAFVLVASALPNTEWAQYKAKYRKVYTSEREDLLRYNEYLKRKKMIEEHNIKYQKGESTYWMGINHFSDWFEDEINRMLGFKPDNTTSNGKPFELPEGTPVPDSMNWVEKGAVTSVKDQGKCGSGYAFSAVGAMEGLMFKVNKTITDLSAQELVDCTRCGGCYGGFITACFAHIIKYNGIDSDISYPYEAKQGECRDYEGVVAAICNGYTRLRNEPELHAAVGTVGPVSVGFSVTPAFMSYTGGVFDGLCTRELNHAMVAVGYDKDKESGKDYWLIKNSWGEDWGEKGYVRVIRHVNKCGLGDMVSYPTYSP